jgi:hypothetical protein
MTDDVYSEDSQQSWRWLRKANHQPEVIALINSTAPQPVTSITHMRSAHYAAYRVVTADGSAWVARIGVTSAQDSAEPDNTGFLNTSTFSPSGQLREFLISKGFAEAGGQVIPISSYHAETGLDITWTPFLEDELGQFTAQSWADALKSLWSYTPENRLPVFTNRTKTFTRLTNFPSDEEARYQDVYNKQLSELFSVATRWSVIHGDAHAENALHHNNQAMLFDFDTACWGPSVWDLSHLIFRAGTGLNKDYDLKELLSLMGFSPEEVAATHKLRSTASVISQEHHTCYTNR